MEGKFRGKNINEFVHIVMLSRYRKWKCYWYKNWICGSFYYLKIQNLKKIILIKHYLKCACFKNTYIDSENNE